MVSSQFLQPLRPRRKQSTSEAKPPHELQLNLQRRLSKARQDLIAVRGHESSFPEEDPHTMPVQIAEATQGPMEWVPGPPARHMAPGITETKESQAQSEDTDLKEEDVAFGEFGDSRCPSPQESSIIDLDSLLDFSDSEISSLSDRNSLRSASRLARFFPELSSHFSVVSPVSADRKMEEPGPTLFERELEERVMILYRRSLEVYTENQQPAHLFPQSEGVDASSSCYSRRTSVTTLGTEFWGDDGQYPHKSPDAYSIRSPASVGVFDDIASISRRSSTVPPYTLHMPLHERTPTKPISMTDLKNKPLPLEPGYSDSESTNRWSGSSRSTDSARFRPHVPTSSQDLSVSPLHPASPASHNEWKSSMAQKMGSHRQPGHAWFGSEYNGHQLPPRMGRQGETDRQINALRRQHAPTLSQATKELEGTLAGLADKESPRKQSDGPVQVSRNKGNWISTRRAPLPPSQLSETRLTPKKGKEKTDSRSVQPSLSPTKANVKNSPQKVKEQKSKEKHDAKASVNSDDGKKVKKKSFLAPFRKGQVRVSARSESQSHMTSELEPQEDITTELLERVVEHFFSGPKAGRAEGQARDKMRQSYALVSTAQASSLQLTDQIYELPAEPDRPEPVIAPSVIPTHNNEQSSLPADMPLFLILSIMEKIDSLDDLFNFVLVNKRIYSAFKRRELPLIKNALFKMSPPAWELREMSPPWEMEWQPLVDPDSRVPEYTPTLYLQRYAQDIFTLAKLKALILARCAPFLRRETVRGLAGVDNQRAEEVDDAFWRVWTFCRIFGSGKRRENDLAGQMDWLKGGCQAKKYSDPVSTMTQPFGINNVLFEPPEGFGRGNLSGLSQTQMYDMTEIWTCMGVLLQPMHGKCIEARKVGIFDNMDVPDNDAVREEIALEWTSYILTLGLGAVMALSSVCQTDTTAAKFARAQSIGLTRWEVAETEASRSSFLKEAISRAYEIQERDSSPAKLSPSHYLSPVRASRERQTAFAKEIRQRRARGLPEPEGALSFADERPMSEYSTILRNLDGRDQQVPPVPTLVLDRSSSTTSITEEPRTPVETGCDAPLVYSRSPPLCRSPPPSFPLYSPPPPAHWHAHRPQVLDPVDRAIDMIVNELGFATEDAKWALKITDTGEGIDAEAAVQLLKKQKKKNERNPFGKRDSLLSSVIKRQKSHESGWRWA
ncbi:unnamed protein product [Penicillium olsonii]|nr:unnamed protein product [Penicillium olsonii]